MNGLAEQITFLGLGATVAMMALGLVSVVVIPGIDRWKGGDRVRAEGIDMRLHDHVGERDHQRLGSRREADGDGLFQQRRIEADPPEAQRISVIQPAQSPRNHRRRYGLGKE